MALFGLFGKPKKPQPGRLLPPNPGKELFARFSAEASGFPGDAVIGAAGNVALNVVLQQNYSREDAEAALNRLHASLKEALNAHYRRKRGN